MDKKMKSICLVYVCVCVCVCVLSCSVVSDSLRSCGHTVARPDPLSMGFSWQEYWSELLYPSLGDLSDPGTGPSSPALQADSFPTELLGKPYMPKFVIVPHV